jgi:hypothetical protein
MEEPHTTIMKTRKSAIIPSFSRHHGPTKLVCLSVSLFAVILCGCEGMRHEKMLTRQEPFRSLIGKRVTLKRAMRIRESPPDIFGFPEGWIHSSGTDAGDIDSAWVVREISLAGGKTETRAATSEGLGLPSKLPAGTVIQFESFRKIQDNNVELPGGIPLERFSAVCFVHFSVPGVRLPMETTTENGRRVQTRTLLECRWGDTHELWPAPWKANDKTTALIR